MQRCQGCGAPLGREGCSYCGVNDPDRAQRSRLPSTKNLLPFIALFIFVNVGYFMITVEGVEYSLPGATEKAESFVYPEGDTKLLIHLEAETPEEPVETAKVFYGTEKVLERKAETEPEQQPRGDYYVIRENIDTSACSAQVATDAAWVVGWTVMNP